MFSLAEHWLMLILATLGVIVVSFWLVGEAEVARRVYKDFVLLIAAPLLALIGWALWALSVASDLPTPLWQALIAGLVIATGWLTSAIFAELGRARSKAEKLRDYHKAIYAEIGTALNTLFNLGEAETYSAQLVARMRADADFVPFIPVKNTILSIRRFPPT